MDQQPANPSSSSSIDFIAELEWRGLIKDCTDLQGLRNHLCEPETKKRKAYAGFDPTADSLTIGNLVPIMMLVHFARAGHEPVVLMGGGTGLIGDPSGKSAERQLMTPETVARHIEGQRPIFANVFRGAGLGEPRIVNNADWLSTLSAIEMLRDVGKHFSLGSMLQRDSVRERLNNREQGISYTEFSYVILQAYDFLHLFKNESVTIQMGGSDQYGNIVAGGDLIRRRAAILAEEAIESRLGRQLRRIPDPNDPGMVDSKVVDHVDVAFGLTCPLVTKADGGKFGKSETGAIWLTADRTSPYAMYQFWLNTADEDVIPFLKKFTLLSREQIEAIEAAHLADPGRREAQRTLAIEATGLVHGPAEAQAARKASEALFSGEIADLPMSLLEQIFAEVPGSTHDLVSLQDGGVDLVDLLIETTLAKSKREAREFVANGSVSVNGHKVGEGARVVQADLLHGQVIALRRGKKNWHLTRWK